MKMASVADMALNHSITFLPFRLGNCYTHYNYSYTKLALCMREYDLQRITARVLQYVVTSYLTIS